MGNGSSKKKKKKQKKQNKEGNSGEPQCAAGPSTTTKQAAETVAEWEATETDIRLFAWAEELRESGHFKYEAGARDLLEELRAVGDTLRKEHVLMLRRLLTQPTALYCGTREEDTVARPVGCCLAHIIRLLDTSDWEAAFDRLTKTLHNRLTVLSKADMRPEQVLDEIEAEGRRVTPSADWNAAFEWLKQVLVYVCEPTDTTPRNFEHDTVVQEVKRAADVFFEASHEVKEKRFRLRPCQLAAILLNVYGVKTRTKSIIEMKTGEGKTFVCGVSAAVVAKLFPDGPAVILTSSIDRAEADRASTSAYITKYLGSEPIFVKDLKPGADKATGVGEAIDSAKAGFASSSSDTNKHLGSAASLANEVKPGSEKTTGAGKVAYGQVSDVQHIAVEMLTENKVGILNKFWKTCKFFLDEADHVLIEQAESLLFIASPCPAYYALHDMVFQIQYRLDYEGEFLASEVKNRAAIPDKAKELADRLLACYRDWLKDHGNHAPLHPTVIDIDVYSASSASGALSARFKTNRKEFIIETTTEQDHHGSIPNVPKLTIIDLATGVESDGTRWTTEAPSLEATEGQPVGGTDPLAFFSAFPYILEKVGWFGGITGTVGGADHLKFYGDTYNMWAAFRIPRNRTTTVFRLPINVAGSEEEQIECIAHVLQQWLGLRLDIPAHGPALIVVENILKAQKIIDGLQKKGHGLTEAVVAEESPTDKQAGPSEHKPIEWKCDGPEVAAASSESAHLFPYYNRHHEVMEQFPDCAIIIASNKGGRGLDLKLDHTECPLHGRGCPLHHVNHIAPETDSDMKSVLFVILTDVLNDRQDLQAVGRCGRSGKAGVVQYQLAKKDSDTFPGDPEAVWIQRKAAKDRAERRDLSSKTNRIIQHRWDGNVLDTFCDNLPVYVGQWMLKLFPSLSREKKKSPAPIPPDASSTTRPADKEANETDVEATIVKLFPTVSLWFRQYVIQAWAYWRGYGGSRRQPGDNLAQFEVRMGLAPVDDLVDSTKSDPMQRFAERFWQFACIMRLSGDALYMFAKALLTSKVELPVAGFCLSLLKQASSPTFSAGGHSMTLPPGENPWQPETFGNAALLYARLSENNSADGLNRAIAALDRSIARYTCYSDQNQHKTAEELSPPNVTATRSAKTYYHVQRVELVAQLQARRRVLAQMRDSRSTVRIKDIVTTLKEEPATAFHAYLLGYGLCEVLFEFYPDGQGGPFASMSAETTEWGEVLQEQARGLGAGPVDRSVGGGVGSAQVQQKTEEEEEGGTKASAGRTILNRIDSETAASSQVEGEENSNAISTSSLQYWEECRPTAADIQKSKTTASIWQTVKGWLARMWAWLVALLTATIGRFSGPKQTGGGGGDGSAEEQREEADRQRQENPITNYLRSRLADIVRHQVDLNGDLVASYLGQPSEELAALVDDLGPLLRQSDIYQEHVEVRSDGTMGEEVSRSDAKKQADDEAKKPVHVRDENMPKEDVYLINKTLEALKELASQQKLQGFDEQLLKMLEAITAYNELAMEGKVDDATAARMNAALKNLWEHTLRFAMDHGSKIKDLQTHLDNYNIAKNQSPFMEGAKKVVKEITEFVEKTVEVVKKGIKKVWGWIKKAAKAVVRVIKRIPIVREVVEWVTETVVNPVYEAAKKVINQVKETVGSALSRLAGAVGSAVSQAVRKAFEKIGQLASRVWNWVSEGLSTLWEWIAPLLSAAWNSIAPLLSQFWEWIGPAVSGAWGLIKEQLHGAWNWFKETSVFKKLAAGLNWLSMGVQALFASVIFPIARGVWKGLAWAWKNLIRPVMAVIAPFQLLALNALREFAVAAWKYLRYFWQGRGQINGDYLWGTAFDIIDVVNNRGRISRRLMRLRAALRRVWESSWLQWFLDPSISRGLDQDPREHVQQQQAQAHGDFLRHEQARKQQSSLRWAVVGALLSVALLISVILSGGALLPAVIAAVSTTLTAVLQHMSMQVEADNSLSDETKKDIQAGISLVQNVVMIASLVFGIFSAAATATVGVAEAAISATVLVGRRLSQFFEYLKKITEALRLEQKAKGILQQVDKILRALGLGGAIAMAVRDTFLGMFNSILDASGSFLGLLRELISRNIKKLQQQQQEEEQLEQQEESEEEEEDDHGEKEHLTRIQQDVSLRTRQRSDGWVMKKISLLLTANSTDQKSKADFNLFGSAPSYIFTKDGVEPITVTFRPSEEKPDVMEAQFSRELTDEEKELFGFGESTDLGETQSALDSLFSKESGIEILGDTTLQTKAATFFNKDGKTVKTVQNLEDERGEVSLVTYASGKMVVKVQPNGEPKPKPMFLDLNGSGSMGRRIRGEVSAGHLQLLADTNLLGSDTNALSQVIENHLDELTSVAADNQVEFDRRGPTQSSKDSADSDVHGQETGPPALHPAAAWIRGAVASGYHLARTFVLAYVSVLWRWFTQNPLVQQIWRWVAPTRLGQLILETCNKANEWIQGAVQLGVSFITSLFPPPLANWLGLEQPQLEAPAEPELGAPETAETEVPETASNDTPVDPRDVAVENLFKALLPSGSGCSGQQEQEPGDAHPAEAALADALTEAFKRTQLSAVGSADVDVAVDLLIARLLGSGSQLPVNQREKLMEDLKKGAFAQALFDCLHGLAVKRSSSSTATNTLNSTEGPQVTENQSKGKVLHEAIAKVGYYSRRRMKFRDPPAFDWENAPVAAKQLSERYGFKYGEGIQLKLTPALIQADLEGFIRSGDQQGLLEYVQNFLDEPMPEEYNDIPGLASRWTNEKKQMEQEIGTKLLLLCKRGWSKMEDSVVADTTYELVELLAHSVDNLWVEDVPESLIDKAIADDTAAMLEWAPTEPVVRIVESNGKWREVVNTAAMGEIHEKHVERMLTRAGFEIIDAKLPSNHGIDVLAVKRNEAGEIIRVWIVECKATRQDKLNAPRLSNTNHGKQLTDTWIAEKITKMYQQESTRDAAILLRDNLDKVRPVVAFQKRGINSWSHQDRVPEFDPAVVEAILQENLGDATSSS